MSLVQCVHHVSADIVMDWYLPLCILWSGVKEFVFRWMNSALCVVYIMIWDRIFGCLECLWASRWSDAGLNRHIFLVGASPTLPFRYGRGAAILGRLFWSIVASAMSQLLWRALRRAGIQLRVKAFLMCRLGCGCSSRVLWRGHFLPFGFFSLHSCGSFL